MNHRSSIIVTVSGLAVAAVVLGSAEASAKVPPEKPVPAAIVPHDPGPPNHPRYQDPIPGSPNVAASADDTAVEALQASASALGGAGIALAGTWLYRRRQTHTV